MKQTGRSMALVGLRLAGGSRLQWVESDHEDVRGIAALSDSHHRVGAVHDSRDATSEERNRSNHSAPPGFRPAGVVRMPTGRSDMPMAVPPNIEQSLHQTVTVPTGAGDIVTQLLWSRLKTRQGMTVLSPREVAKAMGSQATSQPSAGQSSGVTVAKQLKADASLVGQVLVYQERVGGRFGASPRQRWGLKPKSSRLTGKSYGKGITTSNSGQ